MHSVLHILGYIYHILQNTHAHHLLYIFSREEKISFVIYCNQLLYTLSGAAVITTVNLSHCGIVNYTYTQASQQLLINVDHLHSRNMWVSKLVVCVLNDNQELIGWYAVCFSNIPWPVGGFYGVQCSFQRSPIGSHHCCCSTHMPSIKWSCMVSQTHFKCRIPSHATLKLDIILVGFLEISYYISAMTCTVMNLTKWPSIQDLSIPILAFNKDRQIVRLRYLFLNQVLFINGTVIHCSSWQQNGIYVAFIPLKVTC